MSLNASTLCAMACQRAGFRTFLRQKLNENCIVSEEWRFVEDKEQAAIAVRFLLDIDSRRELNTDPDALKRWEALDAEYEFWKRGM